MALGAITFLVALPRHIDNSEVILFATLAISGVLAGMHRIPTVYTHLRIDLTGAILLMAVILTNPSLAVVVAAIVAVLSGVVLRRHLWNVLFNAATEVLAIGLAGLLYHEVVGPSTLPLESITSAVSLSLAAGAYWITNSALVNVLVSSRNGESFLKSFINNWREFYLQCILLTLLAVLGAAAWHQGPLYAMLLFVPTVVIYQLLSVTRVKQEQVIHAAEIIAEVLDRRNPFTFQHSRRVAEHTLRLARQAGLTQPNCEILHRAALIHDIGKLGVDDPSQEFSPARTDLTDYQFYSLKQHAQLGAMIAREIPAFEEAEEPIRYHHDWFDGSHVSRPHAGEEIPLGGRIIAVANSYDQLCMANGEATLTYDPVAIDELQAMGGRQLDPLLVEVFVGILDEERAALTQRLETAQPLGAM